MRVQRQTAAFPKPLRVEIDWGAVLPTIDSVPQFEDITKAGAGDTPTPWRAGAVQIPGGVHYQIGEYVSSIVGPKNGVYPLATRRRQHENDAVGGVLPGIVLESNAVQITVAILNQRTAGLTDDVSLRDLETIEIGLCPTVFRRR